MTVTTTGATHDLACRANATFGVNVIEPSCDLRTSLGPGDWLRVGHNESHGRLRNEDAADLKPWAGSPDRGPPDATRTPSRSWPRPEAALRDRLEPVALRERRQRGALRQGRGEKGEGRPATS